MIGRDLGQLGHQGHDERLRYRLAEADASHAITDKAHRSFKLFEIVFFLEFFRCCVKRCAAYWLYFGEPRFRQLLGNVGACTNARCIGDNNERVVPGFTARKQGSQLDALANNSYRTTASLN